MKDIVLYREGGKVLFISNKTRKRTVASIAVLVKFNQQMK